VLPDRSNSSTSQDPTQTETPFSHTFDLTKRLTLPPGAKVNHIQLSRSGSPFQPILESLKAVISNSPPSTVHRLVIPTVLSPALYPPQSAQPASFIAFLHGLRALLRQHPTRLTAMTTLPLTLHPRNSALTRWAETLSDGVLELTPFPHLMDASHPSHYATSTSAKEEQPQGMVKVHKLPLVTERGEGGAGAGNSIGEDLAFTLSRRKFLVAPFSLPPMEGDQDAQEAAGKVTAKDVEF
jgi:elongator complex protein 4